MEDWAVPRVQHRANDHPGTAANTCSTIKDQTASFLSKLKKATETNPEPEHELLRTQHQNLPTKTAVNSLGGNKLI